MPIRPSAAILASPRASPSSKPRVHSPSERSHSSVVVETMPAPSQDSARPRLGGPIGGERQQLLVGRARGGVLAADVPEPVLVTAQQERPFERLAVAATRARAEPGDGRVGVGVVAVRALHGLDLIRSPEVEGHSLGERDVVLRVGIPGGLHLAARVELLGGERADRLQQRVPPGVAHDAHQPLLDQRVELVQRSVALVVRVADLLHRLECPALVKAGEPPQQPLLLRVEERVAPADRRAERPLAQRQVAIAGGEEVQGVVEPLQQGRGLEDADARGGELQGERQAVEAAADLGDRRGVDLGRVRSQA